MIMEFSFQCHTQGGRQRVVRLWVLKVTTIRLWRNKLIISSPRSPASQAFTVLYPLASHYHHHHHGRRLIKPRPAARLSEPQQQQQQKESQSYLIPPRHITQSTRQWYRGGGGAIISGMCVHIQEWWVATIRHKLKECGDITPTVSLSHGPI